MAGDVAMGHRLKQARERELGKRTSRRLSQLLHVPPQTLYVWEQGRGRPSFGIMKRAAHLVNCDLFWLLTGVGDMDNQLPEFKQITDEAKKRYKNNEDTETVKDYIIKRLQRRIDREYEDGRLGIINVPLQKAVDEFLESRAGASPNTIDWYSNLLNQFIEWVGDRNIYLKNITPDDLMEFRRHRQRHGASPATIAASIRALTALFNWAEEDRNCITKSPVTSLVRRVPGAKQKTKLALTPEQIEKYKEKLADSGMFLVFMFGAYAGLRVNELIHMEREDIQGDVIRLRNKPWLGFTLKDYEERVVPVEDELRPVISKLRDSGLILRKKCDRVTLYRKWIYRLKKHRLPPRRGQKWGVSMHELRHTYASLQIQQRGTDAYTLMRRMGHSRLDTTQGYFHLFRP